METDSGAVGTVGTVGAVGLGELLVDGADVTPLTDLSVL